MNFQFATPWLLSLIIIIPLLGVRHFLLHKGTNPATIKFTKTNLMRGLPTSWRVRLRPSMYFLRLIFLTLVILALGRPQYVQGNEIISGEGVEIALALDISGSMASLDFEPNNRLEAAKQVIGDFVAERQYDKLGLVVFASEAFSQSPLTLDHNMLNRSLDQVELATDLGIEDGTAIGLGLANAANMLANSDAESKVVILLTDGVNNSGQIDPLSAAEAANALGIKVYTIGAARPGQVPVPVNGGSQVVYQESAIDEDTLMQVAEITGGMYFRAEDTSGLRAIYDEINTMEKSQVEVQVFNQYTELAAMFLVPALLIFLVEVILRKTIFRINP
jgi:Ca-activated chloride channel family protein